MFNLFLFAPVKLLSYRTNVIYRIYSGYDTCMFSVGVGSFVVKVLPLVWADAGSNPATGFCDVQKETQMTLFYICAVSFRSGFHRSKGL